MLLKTNKDFSRNEDRNSQKPVEVVTSSQLAMAIWLLGMRQFIPSVFQSLYVLYLARLNLNEKNLKTRKKCQE